jgi:hypothetical protein
MFISYFLRYFLCMDDLLCLALYKYFLIQFNDGKCHILPWENKDTETATY